MARILIVNDETDLVDVCSELLADAGHEVVGLTEGAQAAATAVRMRPDLLVLDWVLDDVTAEAVLRAVKLDPATAHVPVLLMSALVDGDVKAKLYGFDGYLRKPFSADTFLGAIDAMLAGRGRSSTSFSSL